MTVAFRAKSTAAAYSTGSPGVVLPAGIQAGDAIFILVGTKPDTAGPAAATDYTNIGAFTGGTGSTGIDTGPTRIGVLFKEADGTEGGATVTVSVPSNNVSWALGWVLSKDPAKTWETALIGGDDTTGSSSAYSATSTADVGVAAGDYIIAACCIPTDACTVAVDGALTNNLTRTSTTFGTATASGNLESASGQDIGGHVRGVPVSTASGTANLVYTVTFTGSTNTYGPTVFVRARELTPPATQLPARPTVVTRAAQARAALSRRKANIVNILATRQPGPAVAAQSGTATAAGSAHGAAAKKATITGACSSGTTARGIAVKRSATTGAATTGAATTGTARKTGQTSAASTVGASAQGGIGRTAATSSTATAATSAYGTAAKIAAQAGDASVGAGASGTATVGTPPAHDRYPARPIIVARAAQLAAQRAFRPTGAQSITAAPPAAASTGAQDGTAAAGTATYGTAVKKATVTATCTAGTAAAGTTGVVVATRPPAQPIVATRTAIAARRAYQGAPGGLIDYGAPELLVAGAQTGTAAAGVSAHGTARKVATVTGRSTVGGSAQATAVKRSATTGRAAAGLAAHGIRGARIVSGTAAAGAYARVTATKKAVATGTATAGGAAAGAGRKRGQPSAASLAGLGCSGAAGKRAAATGRSVIAVSAGAQTSLRAIGGRCYAGFAAHGRARDITLRPNTGTTQRPDSGRTARPNAGITYRP